MNKLEFNVVVYSLPTTEEKEQINYLANLGLQGEDELYNPKERLCKYVFLPDVIMEYRETYIMYQKQNIDAVVCMYMIQGKINETPPLICSLKEFEEKLEIYENNKKNIETR